MLRERHHPGLGGEPPVALSQIFTRIAADESRDRISIRDLMAALDDRAIGALLLLFAVPNAVPLPPGASSVLGAPLLFLTAQLAVGRGPWLPNFIARRTVERIRFAAVVERAGPWLAKAERLLRPRWQALVSGPTKRMIGGVCCVLALILFLPIPMGNMPPAIAICLFALALLERDGIFVIIGLGAAIAAVAVVWAVIFALLESGVLVSKFFG